MSYLKAKNTEGKSTPSHDLKRKRYCDEGDKENASTSKDIKKAKVAETETNEQLMMELNFLLRSVNSPGNDSIGNYYFHFTG